MARSGPEVVDIFRCYGEAYRAQHDASLSIAQRRVMWPPAHRLQQLPRQTLSPLPIAGPRAMVGRSSRRASRHAVFSCRLHAAGAHCRHRLSEHGTRLGDLLFRATAETTRIIAADQAIQAAMGWHDGNLHAFDIGGEQFGDRHSVDDVADENRVTPTACWIDGRPLHLHL